MQIIPAQLGSISSGTLNPEELLSTFAAELEHLININEGFFDAAENTPNRNSLLILINEANNIEDTTPEDIQDILEELIENLDEWFTPRYAYFGTLEGDGAEFGFFLPLNMAELIEDNEGLIVHDLSEIPSTFIGEVLLINDHGNLSLYDYNKGESTIVWSVV